MLSTDAKQKSRCLVKAVILAAGPTRNYTWRANVRRLNWALSILSKNLFCYLFMHNNLFYRLKVFSTKM